MPSDHRLDTNSLRLYQEVSSSGEGSVSGWSGVGSGGVGVGVGVGSGGVGVGVGVGVDFLVVVVGFGVGVLLVDGDEGGVDGVGGGMVGVGVGRVYVTGGVYGACVRSEAVGSGCASVGGAGMLFDGSAMHPTSRPSTGSTSKNFIAILRFTEAS